jgi:hypothetical protein
MRDFELAPALDLPVLILVVVSDVEHHQRLTGVHFCQQFFYIYLVVR